MCVISGELILHYWKPDTANREHVQLMQKHTELEYTVDNEPHFSQQTAIQGIVGRAFERIGEYAGHYCLFDQMLSCKVYS